MEKFSVLMSVYHREQPQYLIQALDSIFNQSIPPTEVVLVKDGPLTSELDAVTDLFAARFDTLKIVALPKNVGLGEALNQGLKHCSYNLIARMDSDDICVFERFEKQLKIFQQRPDLAVVGSWVNEFENSTTNVVSIRKLPEHNNDLVKFAASRNPLNHPSVMFRKTDIVSVGGYKHFYLFEDYYLWSRLITRGAKLYNIQESLLFFRINQQMVARRGGWKYAVSELRFFKMLHKMKLIGIGGLTKNIIIRFPIRIMPNKIRTFVYKKLLR